MRERTFRVDQDKLIYLSKIHRGTQIAAKLGISKQRWQHYKTGKHDVPESVVNGLCSIFGLERSSLVLEG